MAVRKCSMVRWVSRATGDTAEHRNTATAGPQAKITANGRGVRTVTTQKGGTQDSYLEAPVRTAKVRLSYMIYAPKILLSLFTACFNPAPVGLGPGFGDTPGDPGCRNPHSTGRGVLAAPPPGILCLSALGVPYAGGELAPRGTCIKLVLCVVKRNYPP